MALPSVLKNRLSVPVIGSPLFIVSNPDLVIAQCKAGIVGSFPALNARPAHVLEEWLKRITSELAEWDAKHPDRPSAPFAVNQIVHKSNNRLDHDLELCVKYKVPVVITSLGARTEVNDAVHSYGGVVFHDIINNTFARKAVEKGADGLIAVAAGAGGHAGTLSPFALVQEIREWFDGPLALSGCIAHGGAVLAAQAMGADLAYIGSAFIATSEANAVDAYKQMVVDSKADDIIYTNSFSGVHGNYLKPSVVKSGLDPANLPPADPTKMDFGTSDGASDGATKMDFGASAGAKPAPAGPKAWKDIWSAGQGVGGIKQIQPAGELVARLKREYDAARRALAA